MTFPDQKFTAIGDYAGAYFEKLKAAAASIDADKLEAVRTLLNGVYEDGGELYVCGNGGSASISNHLACDHLKGAQTDTDLKPRVVSLASNMETITAIANDISFDDIFVYQLQTLGRPGDVLLTVSSSGDSENVVRAAQWAKDGEVGRRQPACGRRQLRRRRGYSPVADAYPGAVYPPRAHGRGHHQGP